jgi:hypothetical protein
MARQPLTHNERKQMQNGEMIELFYNYANPPVTLQALLQTTLSIVIDADADFQAIWLIANSTGPFNCRFGDASTGRYFMSGLINNVNLFGTAQAPFPMLPPYVFKRQGSITIDLVNAVAGPNVIQVVFSGKKIFASQTAGAAAPTQR